MSIKSIIILVILFLNIDLLTANISPVFIQRFERFTYYSESHPNLVNNLANFDGVHYISIAQKSYLNNNYAFLPFYPKILSLLSPVFLKNYPLGGVFISLGAFILGLLILRSMLLKYVKDKESIKWFFIFLITFPLSFFFYSVYTEGLFFLLFVSTLYLFSKSKFAISSIFGFLAGLTKFVGVFLIIPMLIMWFYQKKKQVKTLPLVAIFFPILGFLSYCLYLYFNTGDFLGFFHSQVSFNNQRSLNLILLPQVLYRYFRIFITAQLNFQYFVAVLEFGTFIVFLTVLVYSFFQKTIFRKKQLGIYYGIAAFSLINLLIPTVSGTLLSIPRIALISLSFFLVLAQTKNRLIKYVIIGVFAILHILIFSFFSQGYFIS